MLLNEHKIIYAYSMIHNLIWEDIKLRFMVTQKIRQMTEDFLPDTLPRIRVIMRLKAAGMVAE
jgi:hypothetical protein